MVQSLSLYQKPMHKSVLTRILRPLQSSGLSRRGRQQPQLGSPVHRCAGKLIHKSPLGFTSTIALSFARLLPSSGWMPPLNVNNAIPFPSFLFYSLYTIHENAQFIPVDIGQIPCIFPQTSCRILTDKKIEATAYASYLLLCSTFSLFESSSATSSHNFFPAVLIAGS